MSKVEFLTALEKRMASIPQLEKERIMNYYNETIEDALEDGMSEDEIISSFGTMEDILSQIHTEQETNTSSSVTSTNKSKYKRYFVLFLTSPLWLSAIAFVATIYLLYITLILVNACLVLGVSVFFVAGCFNIISVMYANMPSGLVLLGCMLVCLGSLPWIFSLLKRNIAYSKVLYQKGMITGNEYWRKVVA